GCAGDADCTAPSACSGTTGTCIPKAMTCDAAIACLAHSNVDCIDDLDCCAHRGCLSVRPLYECMIAKCSVCSIGMDGCDECLSSACPTEYAACHGAICY